VWIREFLQGRRSEDFPFVIFRLPFSIVGYVLTVSNRSNDKWKMANDKRKIITSSLAGTSHKAFGRGAEARELR
jgi:hypothetical protein